MGAAPTINFVKAIKVPQIPSSWGAPEVTKDESKHAVTLTFKNGVEMIFPKAYLEKQYA